MGKGFRENEVLRYSYKALQRSKTYKQTKNGIIITKRYKGAKKKTKYKKQQQMNKNTLLNNGRNKITKFKIIK